MEALGEHEEREHGTIVFEEGGFAIRVGHWNYFISHDNCPKLIENQYSVAYDSYVDGEVCTNGGCEECNKKYSEEMDGFITLLNWEK